jgi:hypothetical protein
MGARKLAPLYIGKKGKKRLDTYRVLFVYSDMNKRVKI